MRRIFSVAVSALLGACTAISSSERDRPMAPGAFVAQAANADAAESALAGIALLRSRDADVRSYAAAVQADIAKQDAALKTLAAAQALSLSPELSPVDRGDVEDLRGIGLDRFDMEYADVASRHSQQAVRLYDLAAHAAASPPVEAYARTAEPAIIQRFQAADTLFNLVRTDSYAMTFDSR